MPVGVPRPLRRPFLRLAVRLGRHGPHKAKGLARLSPEPRPNRLANVAQTLAAKFSLTLGLNKVETSPHAS